MGDFWTLVGIAVLVVAICHGCTHCDRSKVETDILRQQLKQIEEPAK